MTNVTIRPASEADLPALTRLDLTYPTDRFLGLERSGEAPEHTFAFRWRTRHPITPAAVYNRYGLDGLREVLSRANLFLVAEVEREVAGLLIIIVPSWTDAAEITDLAVDNAHRRLGAGRALVTAASEWARQRTYRALWAEPRADNYDAIQFYLALGFRVAGFNDRLYSNQDHQDGRPTIYMHLELEETTEARA